MIAVSQGRDWGKGGSNMYYDKYEWLPSLISIYWSKSYAFYLKLVQLSSFNLAHELDELFHKFFFALTSIQIYHIRTTTLVV